MKKFGIFLALFATAASADQYYISIPHEDAATLVLVHDLALPSNVQLHDGRLWGFINENTPRIEEYLDVAFDVYVIGSTRKAEVTSSCPDLDPECVVPLFTE